MTEYWMDKRLREKKSIACEGNYIRILADVLVKLQEFKNRSRGKKQSLYEANLEFLAQNGGEK